MSGEHKARCPSCGKSVLIGDGETVECPGCFAPLVSRPSEVGGGPMRGATVVEIAMEADAPPSRRVREYREGASLRWGIGEPAQLGRFWATVGLGFAATASVMLGLAAASAVVALACAAIPVAVTIGWATHIARGRPLVEVVVADGRLSVYPPAHADPALQLELTQIREVVVVGETAHGVAVSTGSARHWVIDALTHAEAHWLARRLRAALPPR
jgi:hypothetical protein